MSVRLPAEERREQILDVAVQVFARQGFHGTSMNDVAEVAGVTKPVLYQHFDSKQDLYLALMRDAGESMLATIAAATAHAPTGRAKTEAGFAAYFHWVSDHPDAFLLLFGTRASRDEQSTDAIRRLTNLAAGAIEALIVADIPADHRRTLAHGLVGMVEGVSRHLVEKGRDFDP